MSRPGSLVPALVYAAVIFTPHTAAGQPAPAGVVTALQGQATVVRTATTEPAPLRFKDDVFLHDRIKTGDQAIVRILLGGRATVTVRERSVLTITEQPGVAQINVGAGRAAIAAVKSRMKPGETIDIVTPNAVASIRGTVVVAEVSASGSTFTVLRGLVDVRQLDPSTQRPVGAVLNVGALQRVTVPSGAVPWTQTITPEAGQRLGNQFKAGPRETPSGVHEAMTETQVRTAVEHVAKLSGISPTTDAADASPSASIGGRDAATEPAKDKTKETAKGAESGSTASGRDPQPATAQPGKSSTVTSPAATLSGAASGAVASIAGSNGPAPASAVPPAAVPSLTVPPITTPVGGTVPITTPSLSASATPALTNPATTPPGLLDGAGKSGKMSPGQLKKQTPLPGQLLTPPSVPTTLPNILGKHGK